jgi:HK97 family phage portal protein
MFQLFRTKTKSETAQYRSIENPSVSLSDPTAWFEMFSGTSKDGIPTVNHKAALSVPAVTAAVKRRATTIASLQCGVYRRTEFGFERDESHPLDFLVTVCPHPLYNAFSLFQTIVTHLDIFGNAFIEIERNRGGDAKRLTIHKPENFIEIRKEVLSGDFFYLFRETDFGQTKERAVSSEDVIHLKGLTLDGITGIDPVALHNSSLSAGISNNEYQARFFGSGAHIQYVLEAPMQFSPTMKTTFREEWKRIFSGIKRAFRDIPIIDSGAKLHPMKMTPAEASMVESKKSTVEEAGRIFDVPGHMIGAGERFTFSSVEVMVNDFVMYSLRNTVKQLENEFNLKAFRPSEVRSRDLSIRFNLDSLLRGDTSTRTKKIETEVKWGIITKNEAREMSGYNKIEDGDKFLTPLNMTTVAEGEEPVNVDANEN